VVNKRKRKLVANVNNDIDSKKQKLNKPTVALKPKHVPLKIVMATKSEEKKIVEKPKENIPPPVDYKPIDLDQVSSAEELHTFGLLHLKHALESRGLKCGGTLEERAERLFSVKGLSSDKYPKKIRAAKK
jgi:hypothetical protein